MNIRALLIFISIAFTAVDACSDEVIFRNKDHITGRVVAITSNEIQLQTPYAGLVRADRQAVAEVHTTEAMRLELVSGESLIGTVNLRQDGQWVIVSHLIGERTFPSEKVIKADLPSAGTRLAQTNEKGPSDTSGIVDIYHTTGWLDETKLAKTSGRGPADGVSDELTPGDLPKTIYKKLVDDEEIKKIFLRQSSVLLRQGETEGEASLSYQRAESSASVSNVRTRNFTLTTSLRYGLTDQAEAFLSVPIAYAQSELAFYGDAYNDYKSGLGDVSGGIKYLLYQEFDQLPEVVFLANVIAPTGGTPSSESLVDSIGSGHWVLKGGLMFLKTYDPVVLFWGMDYTHQLQAERYYNDGMHDVQPGMAIGYNFGVGFAINDKISVSAQFAGSYIDDDHIDGATFGGSSREPATLRFALSNRWSKSYYIEPSLTLGLTSDAPDILLMLSLVHNFEK